MMMISIEAEEMYRLMDVRHNPPDIQNQNEQKSFQAEIQVLYERLIADLSPFGEEGDHYGVSDYSVRPDLKARPSVVGRAPHVREFTITILTQAFFRCGYLEAIQSFLAGDARNYRIVIDQEFDPSFVQTIFLTTEMAKVYCDNNNELSRLSAILLRL